MYCTLGIHSPTWGPRRDRPAVWLSDRFPYNRATVMTMERNGAVIGVTAQSWFLSVRLCL